MGAVDPVEARTPMTITETAPEAEASESPAPTEHSGDLASIVGTGDHKRIGRLFIGASLIGLVATLVAGLVLDLERISATSYEVLEASNITQVMTFQRFGLVLLFALPALLGLAMVVVPLQIGASTLAFGRAAALSFWGWLLGAGLWAAGYLVGGGPGGTDLRGTDLWILATIMLISSLVAGAVCVVTTILGLRTTGMTLRRVPAFTFSMLVAGSVWILTLPVAVANLVLIYLDHRHAQVLWGANEAIDLQLSWVVSQPQIYAIAIPVLGIAADQIPVFAAVRQRVSGALFVGLGLFGILSIGSWAQHAITPTDLLDDPLHVAYGVLAVLPVLMVLALGADTMRSGRIRPAASLIMGLGAGVVLLAATAAGAVYVIEPLDLFGTTWAVGQMELTVLAVALGLFSGLWYWAPKVFGRLLAEGAGRVLGMLLVLGALLATLPLLIAGLLDQLDLPVQPSSVDDPVTALNSVAAAGTAVVLLAVLALTASLLRGRGATGTHDDPWGGHTLEWATASPPPIGNFVEAPAVTDERPLFTDAAEEDTSA
jgi:heme/copper-type cytochrome/quinol oxidase subunit 1